MFTLKGLLVFVFAFISYRIIIPISIFISYSILINIQRLHYGLTLITLAIMVKVFLIVFPSEEKYHDRFFFIPMEVVTPILLVLGGVMTFIAIFAK